MGDFALNREHKELEMKMQDTYQTRAHGLQEQVRLLQQRSGICRHFFAQILEVQIAEEQS